ncbi:dynein light chain Tctex-type 5-like [Dreissena polymorpha]|uniref:Uncharacterized protein n=1 Tax=Dreissena polymorpha TaxID=45954 RepID=A0A9D4BDM1_DREPO|nr:dynein light chain Tctex-type 5-like [Dreissena polymorpha]KAH3698985.1 hypothetical protein DPMN_073931 [Dreissena polymorpha]
MSIRKQSMAPTEGRRKSIYASERKQSFDRMSGSIPVGSERRGSIAGRRMSISERKYSMADSLGGRTGPMSASKDGRTTIKYENTYKTEPDKTFPIYEAKKIAYEVLQSELKGREYDKDECSRASRNISDRIKQQVKALGHPRFKIVCIVTIGQFKASNPSLSFTSRFIWNDKVDNFAEATFKSRDLFGVALVYAVYAE